MIHSKGMKHPQFLGCHQLWFLQVVTSFGSIRGALFGAENVGIVSGDFEEAGIVHLFWVAMNIFRSNVSYYKILDSNDIVSQTSIHCWNILKSGCVDITSRQWPHLFLEFDDVCFPMWCRMMFPKQPKKHIPLELREIHPNFGATMVGLNLLTAPNETFLEDMAISRLNIFIILYYLLKAAPFLYFHLLWYLVKNRQMHSTIKTLTFLPPKSSFYRHASGKTFFHMLLHNPLGTPPTSASTLPSLYSPWEGRRDVFRRSQIYKFSDHFTPWTNNILLMEEILHQLIGSLSHYLQGFLHPRWCRISSIHSRYPTFSWTHHGLPHV